jgi:hypothetical protein
VLEEQGETPQPPAAVRATASMSRAPRCAPFGGQHIQQSVAGHTLPQCSMRLCDALSHADLLLRLQSDEPNDHLEERAMW